jgi:glycosyltransferase involved in cell wall biosynthesis
VDSLGIRDRVKLTGWMSADKVREEILRCRAVVLPSFAEGLPVVLMEAFAEQRPVITTYIAGIPELVENSRSGWLVPAGSVDALTEAIREVFSTSPERLASMGRAGPRACANATIKPGSAQSGSADGKFRHKLIFIAMDGSSLKALQCIPWLYSRRFRPKNCGS